mgnify:CR=1 FL=1
MKGVCLRVLRHPAINDQTSSKTSRLIRYSEDWQVVQLVESPLGGMRVACRGFSKNQFRNEELILGSFLLPPLGRDLLPGGNTQVATRQGRQVAYHGSLNIYRFH